jgi:guanine nucleotide-binding protein G(i) subunit alpha
MKIIHQNGYTAQELGLYRLTIYKNVLDCIKALIGAMGQFNVHPVNAENNENAEYLLEYVVDPDPHTPLNPRVAECVISIWKDPCIAKIMEHQSEFYLMDSAP